MDIKESKIKKFENAPVFERQFEEVYSAYFKRMFLYARKITQSDEIAEDVVSDVFFELWSNLLDFSTIREIEPYLFSAVKNHAIRTISKNKRDLVSLDTHHLLKLIEQTNPEKVLLEKEIQEAIEREIAGLPDQCQLIFKMVVNQQMNYEDVAREMDISMGSVKTQMHKATSKIRERIAQEFSAVPKQGISSNGVLGLVIAFLAHLFLNNVS